MIDIQTPTKKDLSSLISKTELDFYIDTVIECFDLEITRMSHNEKLVMKILDRVNEYYLTKDIPTFFVLVNLKNTTLEVFQDAELRDFVLQLTDKVSLLTTIAEFDYSILINSVVQAICRNKVNPEQSNESLINKELNASLFINPGILSSLLKDNSWLIVLFILTVFFQRSQVYRSLKET